MAGNPNGVPSGTPRHVDLATEVVELLARCHATAVEGGRPDLADRVDRATARVAGDTVRVALVGERGHGKSSLARALLGDRAHRSLPPGLTIVDPDEPDESDPPGEPGEPGSASLPPIAHAVLYVQDATLGLPTDSVDLLRGVAARAALVACVLTKIDRLPDWQRVVNLVSDLLDRERPRIPVFPVSTVPATTTALGGQPLTDTSGIRPLLRWLTREAVGERRREVLRGALAEAVDVCDVLMHDLVQDAGRVAPTAALALLAERRETAVRLASIAALDLS